MGRSKKYTKKQINELEHEDKIPKGALGAIMGCYYKIGAHDFVYYWNDFKWKKSIHNAELLQFAFKEILKKPGGHLYNLHNGGF